MSQNQLLFLQAEKKRKLLIRIARVLVLLGFLSLWEISARCGLIDVFFYSSPTRIARCFLEMTKENQLFMHIGVSLYETILSHHHARICADCLPALAVSDTVQCCGTGFCASQFPAKVSTCAAYHRLARNRNPDDCDRRYFRCDLRLYYQSVYLF